MSEIVIPKSLKPESPAFNDLEKFFRDNGEKPQLFQNFTNHGSKHIQEILNKLNLLIPLKTKHAFSDDAKTVLCLGAFFHDIGMYISFSAFKNYLHEDKWKSKWCEYCQIKGRLPVKDFAKDTRLDLSEHDDDSQFIKDFVRKHHHEFSEDIVLNGFPLLDEDHKISGYKHLYNFDEEDDDQRLQVGILARGHGVENFMSLEPEYEEMGADDDTPRIADDVPIEYFITLLKLADTLDIGGHRGQGIWPKYYAFSDPMSYAEFEFNQSVKGTLKINNGSELHFKFKPKKTADIVKADKVMAKAQGELRDVWAAIGRAGDPNYSCKVSLISSNIDRNNTARKTFSKDFLTEEAKIKVAPKLFTSLAQPLYGYDIYCGIRELIQNAVDACFARKKACENCDPNKKAACSVKQAESEVTVNVDTNAGTITVTDNGIGMNARTIVDYYLVAGAKYRESEAWRTGFVDDTGHATTIRSGRFGIGVLAGFLLGSKITVTTRFCQDDQGYNFDFDYSGECSPNIPRVPAVPVGTQVCIELGADQKAELAIPENTKKWTRWYYPTEPKMHYYRNGQSVHEISESLLPQSWPSLDDDGAYREQWGEPLEPAPASNTQDLPFKLYWRLAGRDAEAHDYSSYRSLYSYYWRLNGIYCYNGIKLQDGAKRARATVRFIEDIDISVVDPDAEFDLSLTRDSFEVSQDVEEQINDAIIKRYDRGSLKKTIKWINENVQEGASPGTGPDRVLVAINNHLCRVLYRVNNKALLISELAFAKAFDKTGSTNLWAECSLKKYLNGETEIVREEEKQAKRLEWLPPDGYLAEPEDVFESETKPGSKVFVLSIKEAEGFFDGDADRQACIPGDPEWADWWLRSPGSAQGDAANVNPLGDVSPFGFDVRNGVVGVRPAFWLNLKS